jgi:hypothetical protein
MRGLGYEEGKNLVMKYQWAQGRHERHPELAAELVRLKVDVIVTGGCARPLFEAIGHPGLEACSQCRHDGRPTRPSLGFWHSMPRALDRSAPDPVRRDDGGEAEVRDVSERDGRANPVRRAGRPCARCAIDGPGRSP